ncbi:histidine--tRNA ligase [Patescibacteria group bacterium]
MPAKTKKKAAAVKPKAKRVKKSEAKKVVERQPIVMKSSVRKGSRTPQSLRGMRDILAAEQVYWHFVRTKAEALARAYGYDRIDTPIVEDTNLFVRSVGKHSDIVEKEMFTFEDKGGDSVTLRPEGTASAARAYVNHGMLNLPQPVKMYYWGPMFRYERPQAGRYRQHHQFGFEIFGDDQPIHDAEIISLAHLFYKEIGIKTTIHINSLGCKDCRPLYHTALAAYYKPKKSQLCEDCKRRFAKNPLRLLDCKERTCIELRDSAPQLVDSLDDDCKDHLMHVLEYLDDLQIPYVLDPYLVRGLDYYTRTVFEIMPSEEEVDEEEGEKAEAVEEEELSEEEAKEREMLKNMPIHAIGGGGRYDNLVEDLGGRPTPACGFSIGVERAILQMKSTNTQPLETRHADVFLAQLGDTARRKSFVLFEELRNEGVQAAANFSKNSLKSQLEIANRLNAKYTAIIGQQEVLDGTILLRDMESGMQEIVDFNKIIATLKKKLGKA